MNRQNYNSQPKSTAQLSASGSEPNMLSAERIKKAMLRRLDCQIYAEAVLETLPLNCKTLESPAFRDKKKLIPTIQVNMRASKNNAKELAHLERYRRDFINGSSQESRGKDDLRYKRRHGVFFEQVDSFLATGDLAQTQHRRQKPQTTQCPLSSKQGLSATSGLQGYASNPQPEEPLPADPSVNKLITSMGAACSLEERNCTSEAHSTFKERLEPARQNLTGFFRPKREKSDYRLLTQKDKLDTYTAFDRLFGSVSGDPSQTSASSFCRRGALLGQPSFFQDQPPSYEESQRQQEVEASQWEAAFRSALLRRGGLS
ncbi:hypothetical protein [Candidiatus Paracoxiella cheracis]|uniref:hypothetical protein n=1 Tax=Candidiatus Paracoxiella cheracis TaxID=3405120 RepID=UPI003BF5CD37